METFAHEKDRQVEAFNDFKEGIYLVTQHFATHLLDNYNRGNRRLKEKRIVAYKTVMDAGKWFLNGECCIFSRTSEKGTPRLISAQHRLEAVKRACQPVKMEFKFIDNDSSDLVNSIDCGIPRTAGDHLTFSEEGISNKHAAIFTQIAKLGVQFDKGVLNKKVEHTSSIFINGWVMENLEFLEKFMAYPSPLDPKIPLIEEKSAKFIGKPSILFTAYVINKKWGFDEAVSFCEKLIIGNNLNPDSPILVAKDHLTSLRVGYNKAWKNLTRVRSNTLCRAAIICKAFNRYKQGQPMKKMTLMDKDVEKEILELEKPKSL